MDREEAADKILKWLDVEGWKYNILGNESKFYLVCRVEIDENSGFTVCIEKIVERVIILSSVTFADEDKNNYKLSKEKYTFWIDLKIQLMLMGVQTKIEPNIDELESIELTKVIYFDGLTQDKFIDTTTKITDALGLCNIIWRKFVDSTKKKMK